MRKGFDGLYGLVTTELKADPLSGDVYVFMNKRRNRIKLLYWDGDGLWIFYKRLEKGTFQLPPNTTDISQIQLPYNELLMIMEGIDLNSVKRRSRYQRQTLNP